MGHARQGFETFRDIAEQGQPLRRSEFLERRNGGFIVPCVRCEDDEQDILRIEAQVDAGEKEEAARHQPCSDQKDNGESDLSYDQCGAKLSVAEVREVSDDLLPHERVQLPGVYVDRVVAVS